MKNEKTAKRLQLALNRANIKPQELANKANVNKASISQYINGSHAPSNISSGKMASILDVNPVWLMGYDVPMELIDSSSPVQAEKTEQPKIMQFYDILNDIGKHEATKRVEELTFLPQYTSAPVKAARNDYINEDGELEKTQRDLSLLKRPD